VVPAAAVIRSEIESIRSHGFSDDEFNRVRPPFLRQRSDDLRTNTYWCYTVLDDAQQRPERLAAARNRIADSAAITRAEIEALARRYLDPSAGFMFVAEPGVPHLWGRK
jgi:zinc protease